MRRGQHHRERGRPMTRATLLAALAAAAIAACQPGDQPGSEYMPDMARSPRYNAFAPNRATRSGITLQRPVPGTIARGYHPFHYARGDAEGERAGRELTNPFHPTQATLDKGKVLYETYCLVCHGAEGKGDGPIATKIPPPSSYKSDRVLGFLPGRIFHVVTLGSNKMPSYAAQLSPDDRWLIITYVRATLQGLPEAGPGMPDAPPAPAPGATPPADPAAPVPGATPPPATGSGGSR
ncbi:MAG: cytochrome c [Deltaproteobacteria bacterium]|nr:MAG: cytochrome c [Deltaproteobacteria bacterium]